MLGVQRFRFVRSYARSIGTGITLFLLRLCAVVVLTSSALAQPLSGRANVVDGDTLVIGETHVRLSAIDAPETDQTCLDAKGSPYACGIVARDRLRTKINNSSVICIGEGEDQYGRSIATCRIGNEDLNKWLVAEGLALAYVQYSDRYVADENGARTMRKGLWAGAFVAPWDWRHRAPNTPLLGTFAAHADRTTMGSIKPASPPVAECNIKGNVNRSGERIYFLPSNSAYGNVKMDKGLGERRFCSEQEAIAAGWRKARNER